MKTEQILVMDLEAVPCPVMGQRVYGTMDPLEIMAARLKETDARTDFLEPAFWQPVALGMVGMNVTTGTVRTQAISTRYEQEIIVAFHNALKSQPELVTYNGRGFDIPVIQMRTLRYGLQLPNLHQTQKIRTEDSYRHRYGALHTDLADEMSNYGSVSKMSLDKLCALLDIPCKRIASGAKVLEYIAAGDYETPRRYVLDDALATARAYLRWRLSQAWLPVELCDALDTKLAALQAELVPEAPPQLELASNGA